MSLTTLDRLKYDFWVTADRQFLFFTEMSDSHLRNTIAMLIRKAPELQEEADKTYRLTQTTKYTFSYRPLHPQKWLSQQRAFIGLIAERKRRKAL